MDEAGNIITDENMHTNVEGVFAAGDIRKKSLKQVVTAAADGAIAAMQVEKYVNACKQSRKMSRTKIFNDTPYISVCLAALNMKLYMEQNLLSIINQSFQDFEIVIVNDHSKDETEHIIRNLQSSDSRIKLINHPENLGVYRSRIEAILNAKGEFILLMDPDDMFLNKNLFKELYNYNLNNNLDIVEFSVYQQKEGEKKTLYYKKKSQEIIQKKKIKSKNEKPRHI